MDFPFLRLMRIWKCFWFEKLIYVPIYFYDITLQSFICKIYLEILQTNYLYMLIEW